MSSADTVSQFFNEPIVVAMASVMGAALITLVGAILRMLNKLSKMESDLGYLRSEILELKTDPDVMRWSNYGRASQAFGVPSGQGGAHQ